MALQQLPVCIQFGTHNENFSSLLIPPNEIFEMRRIRYMVIDEVTIGATDHNAFRFIDQSQEIVPFLI